MPYTQTTIHEALGASQLRSRLDAIETSLRQLEQERRDVLAQLEATGPPPKSVAIADPPPPPLLSLDHDSLWELYARLSLPLALKLTCKTLRDGAPKQTKAYPSQVVASLPMLKWAIEEAGLPTTCVHTAVAIARGGCLEAIDWARSAGGVQWDARRCLAALAERGHLHVLQALVARGEPLVDLPNLMTCAVFNGHVPVAQWLVANGSPIDVDLGLTAVEGGHVPMLQWLRTHHAEEIDWADSVLHIAAARKGFADVLTWLETHVNELRSYMVREAFYGAVECGQLALAKRLYERLDRVTEKAYQRALAGGHLETVKWMHALPNTFRWETATGCAARSGSIELLEWCRDEGYGWNERVCETAAQYGHLAALQWLRANECPWVPAECRAAALQGHNVRHGDWVRHSPDQIRVVTWIDSLEA